MKITKFIVGLKIYIIQIIVVKFYTNTK